ncbi:DNAJC17, partial [Symbiodinium necroappetens]
MELGESRRVGKGRRPSTLRKHVKTWEKFVLWLKGAYNIEWPEAPCHFIDYLEERASEPCGKSIPLSLLKTLMFMESSAEVPKTAQISNHPAVSNSMQEITRFLETASPSEIRKANMFPVKVVMAFERAVTDNSERKFVRAMAWYKLVKVWGALRHSDAQGVDYGTMKLSSRGLEAVLARTKTTGPGKSVKRVKFYISKDAWIGIPGWLGVGWEIWDELSREASLTERDFLLPVPGSSLESLTRKVASYADAAALSKALLSNLKSGEGPGHLLLPGMAAMWTEHSERATLRSWAGAAAISPGSMKRLGRWKQDVDEGYDRTDRAEVEKSQAKIASFIRSSRGKVDQVDEEGLLAKIASRASEQGFEPTVASEQLMLLSYFGPDTDPVTEDTEQFESASDSEGVVEVRSDNEALEDNPKPDAPANEIRGKFFVSVVGRSRQKTLHRSGECYRVPGIHYKEFLDLGDQWPDKTAYHKACKVCFPKQVGPSGSDDKESSSSEDEVRKGCWSSSVNRRFTVSADVRRKFAYCQTYMARPDINTEAGQKILAAQLDADFSGLAQAKGIPLKRQAELAQLSILAISRYSAVADDRPGLRTFCKDVLHLDPATDAAHLVEDIKSRFEALHYALDDKATPASATLELHFDQVEQGELRPTTLSQYVSREHVEAEHYGAVIDKSTGMVRLINEGLSIATALDHAMKDAVIKERHLSIVAFALTAASVTRLLLHLWGPLFQRSSALRSDCDLSIEVVQVSEQSPDHPIFLLWEHPEDLGMCVREEADARSGIPVDTSVGSPCRAHGARTSIEEVATSVASAQVGGGVKQSWGHGPQIMAWYKGSSRPIHDGGGLLSPGRWPIGRRDYSLSARGEGLRDVVHEQFKYWCEAVRESGKDVMKDKFWPAAAGLIRESPFSEHIESARFAVDEFLHQEGLEPGRRPEDLESEIAFRRIAAAAEVLGDVDFQYLREVAEVGVPIGVGVELPRVPDVFEPKVKWNLSEAEGEFVDTKADNYSSAVESMAKVREQVEEDVRKGFIKRMSRSEAELEYQGRLAVAALGAVPKALDSDEVRVVHDGSHSVDVNHRIRVLDRIRNPLVDDAEAII